jgi:two-component SAPR family response regulator
LDYLHTNLHDVDVFILDIWVPGRLNGLDIASKIRNLGSNKVVIITSAFQKPNAVILKTLNCQWIPKPWHILDAAQRIIPLVKESVRQRTQIS